MSLGECEGVSDVNPLVVSAQIYALCSWLGCCDISSEDPLLPLFAGGTSREQKIDCFQLRSLMLLQTHGSSAFRQTEQHQGRLGSQKSS